MSGKTSLVLVVKDHCQRSAEVSYRHLQYLDLLKEVQTAFDNDSRSQFFVMDGEKNEISTVSWLSLPILILFPSNSKAKPLVYDGSVDVDGVSTFIKDHR